MNPCVITTIPVLKWDVMAPGHSTTEEQQSWIPTLAASCSSCQSKRWLPSLAGKLGATLCFTCCLSVKSGGRASRNWFGFEILKRQLNGMGHKLLVCLKDLVSGV